MVASIVATSRTRKTTFSQCFFMGSYMSTHSSYCYSSMAGRALPDAKPTLSFSLKFGLLQLQVISPRRERRERRERAGKEHSKRRKIRKISAFSAPRRCRASAVQSFLPVPLPALQKKGQTSWAGGIGVANGTRIHECRLLSPLPASGRGVGGIGVANGTRIHECRLLSPLPASGRGVGGIGPPWTT